MSVRVHIEHLVLHGLPLEPQGESEFRAALEAELGRRLGERDLRGERWSGGALESLRAPDFACGAGTHPSALGHSLATAISGGVQW